ncbi:MAG: SpoIIE family protein phosphatase [Prevotella sp.]|nr:SpoIIE family protein phosphatase [Prevotella sp.]
MSSRSWRSSVDLWSGQAALDKLGAAGSWLYQQGRLTQLTGDALPVGILENIESRECSMRLSEGDALILVTDGVEEAFGSRGEMEAAVWLALEEKTPADAAKALLEAAGRAEGGVRRDDQTAVVIRIGRTRICQDTPDDV